MTFQTKQEANIYSDRMEQLKLSEFYVSMATVAKSYLGLILFTGVVKVSIAGMWGVTRETHKKIHVYFSILLCEPGERANS